MEKFPPSPSITASVKMTKTLYAQLMNQRFHPPKPFKLPPISSDKFKAAELGMKLVITRSLFNVNFNAHIEL